MHLSPSPSVLRTYRSTEGALCWYGCLAVLIAIGSPAARVVAEAPSLSRLYPSGGQRGEVVTVEAKGKFDTNTVTIWCDNPGLQWKTTDQPNQLQVTIAADAKPGRALMRLVDAEGVSDVRPFIVSGLPEIVEAEPNNELGEAMPVDGANVIVNGVLQERADVDHFQLNLKAGQLLVASVTSESELQSPLDATLQIVTTDGHVLAQNLDYHGLDPLLAWRADRDGEFLVRVFGFPAAPDSTIGLAGGESYLYRLALTTGPFVEGFTSLAVTASEPSALYPWGWNLDGAAPLNVDATAMSEESISVLYPGAERTIAVPVVADKVVSNVGDDAVVVGQLIVETPVVITGEIREQNQRDAYHFRASKGSVWIVEVESRSLGYPLDPLLEIEAADSGKQLVREDDTAGIPDARVRWTAPDDGTYVVRVSDVNRDGGPAWLYRLRIRPERPRVRLTMAADRYEVKVGEALEIPVKVERKEGFKQLVRISLTTPVEGLEVEASESAVEGDSSKEVKLKLKASRPLTAPIELQGVYEGDTPGTVKVTGPLDIQTVWLRASE